MGIKCLGFGRCLRDCMVVMVLVHMPLTTLFGCPGRFPSCVAGVGASGQVRRRRAWTGAAGKRAVRVRGGALVVGALVVAAAARGLVSRRGVGVGA